MSVNMIKNRIKLFPRGQWVAVVKARVIGVLYTQRIISKNSLIQDDVNFGNQSKLHNQNGSVLQLLSIAVHPDYSHLQVGQALRDFVKRICADKFSGNRFGSF